MSDSLVVIFQLAVLIFSVMVHEISHGAVALRLGDPTAKNAGRLTLNPLKHLDPFGSLFLPLMMFFLGGPIFGWAKPVPYNPLRLKNPKIGAGLIGAAGPLSNLLLAGVFGLLLRGIALYASGGMGETLYLFLQMIILINIALAVFNLIPVPPLDGASILFVFLPESQYKLRAFLSRYGFYIIILIIVFDGIRFIGPVIEWLYRIIV